MTRVVVKMTKMTRLLHLQSLYGKNGKQYSKEGVTLFRVSEIEDDDYLSV